MSDPTTVVKAALIIIKTYCKEQPCEFCIIRKGCGIYGGIQEPYAWNIDKIFEGDNAND